MFIDEDAPNFKRRALKNPCSLTAGPGLGLEELVGVSGDLTQRFILTGSRLLESIRNADSRLLAGPLVLDNDTLDQEPDELPTRPERLFAIAFNLLNAISQAQKPRLG